MSAAPRSTPDVTFVGFITGHGGDALQMLTLARGVQARGATVDIVVADTEHSETFARRCAEVGLTCEPTSAIAADLTGPRQRLRSMVSLIRRLDAKVVHFHTGNSVLPRSPLIVMEAFRFPRAFVTLQSPYETVDPGSWRARFWARAAPRRFHAVVSPSEHGTEFQRRCGLPAERLATVRNAIDVDAFAHGDPDGPRAELGIGPDAPVVLFSSRIDPQKRPVDAVDAFAAVADRHPTALLVFVGSGSEDHAVRDRAASLGVADRVRLLGYRTDIADWLAAATVWLLPTERENFSVAVLEALAAGCAVLSTRCPGNDEVLVDGRNALTFEVGDVDSAAASLDRLLCDAPLREHLGAGGRATAAEYTADKMVDRYCDLYLRHVDVPSLRGS